MRKLSPPERWVLAAAAGFFLFVGGWTLANARNDAPYQVTAQHSAAETAQSALPAEEETQPDSLLPGERININTAGEYDLRRLPGIGEKRAQAIADDREANGPYQTAEDLLRVSGIGEKTLEQLRDYIRTDEEQDGENDGEDFSGR